MQCSCGAETVTRKSLNGRTRQVLTWAECHFCHRCDFFRLETPEGNVMVVGRAAVSAFDGLKESGIRTRVAYIGEGCWAETRTGRTLTVDDFVDSVPGRSPAFAMIKA